MENLFIGVIASFIIFLLFFLVFLVRGRNDTETGRPQGCGQPKGQCHCRRPDAPIPAEGFTLDEHPPERRLTPEATCARDTTIEKSTGDRQKPS